MVIGSVHGRAHQVHGAGIHPQILLMNMLLVNHLRHEMSIGPRHEASQLRVHGHVPHACRNQNLLKCHTHALAYGPDVVGLLIGTIGYADTSRQIHKGDTRPRLLLQPHRQPKQLPCQLRVIFIGHGVAGQKRMDAEGLHALVQKEPESLKHLSFRKAVLGVSRIVHDVRPHGEIPSGIKPAA